MDSYNANPSSMKVALENFSKFKGTKICILGDMYEIGKESENEHKQIIQQIKDLGFNNFYLLGNLLISHRDTKMEL